MGRTRLAEAAVAELRERISKAKTNIKKLENYQSEISKKFLHRAISGEEYNYEVRRDLGGGNLKSHINTYEKYIHDSENIIKKHKKEILRAKILKGFFGLFFVAIFLAVIFSTPTFIGFFTQEPSQNFVDNVNLKFTESSEYNWTPQNQGILDYVKINGIHKGNGNLKVYLDDFLIYDSSPLINSSAISSASSPLTGNVINENKQSSFFKKLFAFTGLASEDESSAQVIESYSSTTEEEAPASPSQDQTESSLPDETPASQESYSSTTGEEASASPSQDQESPLLPDETNITSDSSITEGEIPQNASPSQDSNETLLLDENQTQEANETSEEIFELNLMEICRDTCNLGNYNLNKSSYNIRIEISNSQFTLNNISYGIIPFPEEEANITELNITEQNITELNVSELNITELNVTEINITSPPVLIKEIPNIEIQKNNFSTINISEYFENGEEFFLLQTKNISTTTFDHTIKILPDTDFIGTRASKLIVRNSFGSVESNFFNITVIENATLYEANISQNVSTFQYKAIINLPTKWIKVFNFTGDLNNTNLTVDLPKGATNISVRTGAEVEQSLTELGVFNQTISKAKKTSLLSGSITGNVALDISNGQGIFVKMWKWLKSFTLTGNVIREQEFEQDIKETPEKKIIHLEKILDKAKADKVGIEYYTEGPISREENLSNGKRVILFQNGEVNYTDILVFTTIPEEVSVEDSSKIKVYWKEGKKYVNFSASDTDGNGKLDYIEWISPDSLNQTFDIIVIIKAEHLDENRTFVSDIYEQVKALDNNWSETIPSGDYVRVTFEIPLDNTKDITLYPRVVNGTPRIEVYELNGTNVIAEFTTLNSNEYNKVFLTNLNGTQDTFDLKIVGGSVEFDYIVDPSSTTTPIITPAGPYATDDLTCTFIINDTLGAGTVVWDTDVLPQPAAQTPGQIFCDASFCYIPHTSGNFSKTWKHNGTIVWGMGAQLVQPFTGLDMKGIDCDDSFCFGSATLSTAGGNISKAWKSNGTIVWGSNYQKVQPISSAMNDLYCSDSDFCYGGHDNGNISKTWKSNGTIIWGSNVQKVQPVGANGYLGMECDASFCYGIHIGLGNLSKVWKSNGTIVWGSNYQKVQPLTSGVYLQQELFIDDDFVFVGNNSGYLSKTWKSNGTVVWGRGGTQMVIPHAGSLYNPFCDSSFCYSSHTDGYLSKVWKSNGTVLWDTTVRPTTTPMTYVYCSGSYCYGIYQDGYLSKVQTSVSAYVEWFKNGVSTYSVYLEGLNNATNSSTTLLYGNLTAGEAWKCEVTPANHTTNGTAVNSSAVTILSTSGLRIVSKATSPETIRTNINTILNLTCADDTAGTLRGWNRVWLDSGSYAQDEADNSLIVVNNTNTQLYNYSFGNYSKGYNITFEVWCQNATSNTTHQNTTEIIVLGVDSLDITSPTTAVPLGVTSEQNISIYFNYSDEGTEITSAVTMENVTIGGVASTICTYSSSSAPTSYLYNSSVVRGNTTFTTGALNTSWNVGWQTTNITTDFANILKNLSVSDNLYYNQTTGTTTNSDNLITFNFTITEPVETITSIQVWMEGRCHACDAGESVNPEIANFSSSAWVGLGNFTAETSRTKIYTTGISNFIRNGQLVLAFQGINLDGAAEKIMSDYVRVMVNATPATTTPRNFSYIPGVGWQVNVTAPAGLSGLQDLYLNATYAGTTLNDTQPSAISYAGGGTAPTITIVNPTASQQLKPQSVTFALLPKDGEDLTGLWTGIYLNISGGWSLNGTNTSAYNNTQTNITSVLPDGTYKVGAFVNDSSNSNAWSSNVTFTVDSTAPTVRLPVYTNATKKKNTDTLTLNVSVIDAGVGGDDCTISINGNANQTFAVSNGWCNTTAISLNGLADGNKTISVYVNDTLNNLALNNSFVVWIDSTVPTVTLPVYTNATQKKNTETLTLNVSVTDSGSGLTNGVCLINVNGTNQSFSISNGWCNTTNGNLTGLGDGNRTILVYANDSANNMGLNNSFAVWIDSTAPTIRLPVYTNATKKKNTDTLTLNVSVIDAGTGLTGSACKISINGNANQTFAVSNGWCNTTTISLTSLTDGNKTISVYVNDTLNNLALNNSFAVWIDSTAPTVRLPVYTNATQKQNTQTLTLNISVTDSGSGLTGSACKISINGNANQTFAVSNGWCNTTTISLTGLSDGNKTISVYVNDTLNNMALNNSFAVWIDTTAPTVTLPFYTNATQKGNTDTLTLNVSVTDAGVGGDDCTISINGNANQTFAVSNGWCNTTAISLTGLADGNKTISVYVNDTLNNLALNNSFVVWIVSNSAPTITIVNPTASQQLKPQSVTFALLPKDGEDLTGLWTGIYLNISGGWSLNGTNTSAYNNTQTNITSVLPDGTYKVGAFVNDSSNSNAWSSNVTFTVDSTAPTVRLPVYTNATKKKNTDTLTLNISVIDAGGGGDDCTISINGNANQTFAVSNGWCNTTTISLTGLSDGNKTISVYVNDTLNNLALNNSFAVWIDSTAPTVTLPVYTNATQKKNTQTLTLNVSVTDSGSGLTNGVCLINVNGTNQTFSISNGWCNTTNGNLTGLGDGNRTILVYANDSANNMGLNNSFAVWIDSTAPTIRLPVYTNATQKRNTDTLTLNVSVIDAGTGLTGSACKISINGNANQTFAVSNGWCNTTTISLTSLTDGNKTISVYVNDTLNNLALNNSFVVWIDSTVPIVTLPVYTNATQKANTDTLTLNISVVDAGVGLTNGVCLIDINGTNQTFSISNGWCNTTNGNLTGLGDGNRTILVYANDSANNMGLNNSFVVWIVSNFAPTIDIVWNTTMTDISSVGTTEAPLPTYVMINFTASDANGYTNLDDSSAVVNFSKSGGDSPEDTRTNSSCARYGGAGDTANYTCNVTMWWWDGAGKWTINTFIKDLNGNSVANNTGTFIIGATSGVIASPTFINWSQIAPSATNVLSNNDPLLLNNTGNTEKSIQVNATNLLGETDNTKGIYAKNFSVNVNDACEGTAITNPDVYTTITGGATLPKGNYTKSDGTGQEQLYFCIEAANGDLIAQYYSTAERGAWTVKIFAVLILSRRRKKKANVKQDVLFKSLIYVKRELMKEYSSERENLLELLTKELVKKYTISKKDVSELAKEKREISIPLSIFSSQLGALEAITKYMKENLSMNYHEIGESLGRDERTIWTAYNKSKKKLKSVFAIEEKAEKISLSKFRLKELTILEAIIFYLKQKGMKYVEISNLISRDQRNIWTIYNNAKSKLN